MLESIEIPMCGPVRGSVHPPGSKSITNRALVCAALADGTSRLTGALDSEDTHVMIESLARLGILIDVDATRTEISVAGCGGRLPAGDAELQVANSGTTVRFLTALATLGRGNIRLDGVERMRERPIKDLLEALTQLGGDVRSELDTGCPPVVIQAGGLDGGTCRVRGNISSQYLSALLMVAPYAREQVQIDVEGELVSRPYIEMTLAVMRQFGVAVESKSLEQFVVPAPQAYKAKSFAIEPDASAATYFLGAAAITGGTVTVEGLSRSSLQGDVAFADCLAQMGCEVDYGDNSITVTGGELRGIDINMNAISDTVQTLAAVALFADGPTSITGVAHNRFKETDRIGDLATELRRLGAQVDERDDGLRIVPGTLQPARIETYDDHRMAMSLALVGLGQPGVVIENPGCTAKTYPKYFDDLAMLASTAD